MGRQALVDALIDLGFSTYESRVYVGLVATPFQTAYGLAKETGVPQPKVYEVLRRLQMRGMATLVSHDPQKFVATSPDEVLGSIEREHDVKLTAAQHAATTLATEIDIPDERPASIRMVKGQRNVLREAVRVLETATEKAYISGWSEQLTELLPTIHELQERGVEVVVIIFGRMTLDLPNGIVFSHLATQGVVYRHHQNRHLAVVADGERTAWSLALDGDDWSCLVADDALLAKLVRTFIRHDIYVQRLHQTLRPEVEEAFGPGLERLSDLSAVPHLRSPEATTEESARNAG